MWIRSQNKKELVNTAQVERIRIYYFVGKTDVEIRTDNTVLGEYSTEEKAIKVLDMIQKEILKVNCVLSPINNGEVVRMLGYAEPPKVFEMPQDSEVK